MREDAPSMRRAVALNTLSLPAESFVYSRGQPPSSGLWNGGISATGHAFRAMEPGWPSVDDAVAHGGTTAVRGEDYDFTSATVSWADADDTPKAVAVPLLNDEVYETETVSMFFKMQCNK